MAEPEATRLGTEGAVVDQHYTPQPASQPVRPPGAWAVQGAAPRLITTDSEDDGEEAPYQPMLPQ